jgi:hypothetical protein
MAQNCPMHVTSMRKPGGHPSHMFISYTTTVLVMVILPTRYHPYQPYNHRFRIDRQDRKHPQQIESIEYVSDTIPSLIIMKSLWTSNH